MDTEDVARVCMYVSVCASTHVTYYYSATEKKKDEIWPFMTTWMDLEGIVLN